MTQTTPESKEHEDGSAPDLAERPVQLDSGTEELGGLWREYGRPVVIGVVLGLALVLGYAAYKNHQESVAERASQLLTTAQSGEDFRAIVTQYPESAAAPIAKLAVAARYFEGEQYALAQQTYADFEQQYPEHPMAKSAALGKAYCLEASGRVDEARNAFSTFAQVHKDHYLEPIALLGTARCLQQLGDFDEARVIYEDYIAANPDSPWIARFDSELTYLDKAARAVGDEKAETDLQDITVSPFAVPSVQ